MNLTTVGQPLGHYIRHNLKNKPFDLKKNTSEESLSGTSSPATDIESPNNTPTHSDNSDKSITPPHSDNSSDDSNSPYASDEEDRLTDKCYSQFDGIKIDLTNIIPPDQNEDPHTESLNSKPFIENNRSIHPQKNTPRRNFNHAKSSNTATTQSLFVDSNIDYHFGQPSIWTHPVRQVSQVTTNSSFSNKPNSFQPISTLSEKTTTIKSEKSDVLNSAANQSLLETKSVDEIYKILNGKATKEKNRFLRSYTIYRTNQINWYSALIENTSNFESENANVRKLNKAFQEFQRDKTKALLISDGSDLYESICRIIEGLKRKYPDLNKYLDKYDPNVIIQKYKELKEHYKTNQQDTTLIDDVINQLSEVNLLFKKAEYARFINFLKKSYLYDEAKANGLEKFSLPHPSTIKDKKLKAVVNAYNAIFKTRENLKQNLHNFIHGRQLTIDFNYNEFIAILTCGNDQVAKRFIGEIKKEYMESVDSK